VRVLDSEHCPPLASVVADHVALPDARSSERALVRLNMVASADGGSAVAGLSGGLGNRADHLVFGALRERADIVIVGMSTAVAEHYHPPESPRLQIYVIATRPDVSANAALFDSGQVTLVLPEDAPPAPDGISELRAGQRGRVDLARVVEGLPGKVVMTEGGPRLAGTMIALGLVDEFFLTVSPRVVAGDSPRVVHGPDADADIWQLRHGFVDDEGFLFLRYARP
jgi:riboflavin biosynthesis pyrimidine reductase